MDQQESTKPKRNYGWVILGLCFGNLIVEGGVTRSQPVFLPALRQGFGGSAAMTAAIFSASGFFGGLAAPVLGKILDIIGPKYMFPLAGIVILLGWWACSMVNHMWQLFIFYSLISALGHISIGSFTTTAVLAPWFPKSKGVMLGIADSGNATGQAITPPLLQLAITHYGWRAGFRIFGILFFLIAAPLNFLLQKRAPDSVQKFLSPEDTLEENTESSIDTRSQLGDISDDAYKFNALKEPAVWMLLVSRATASISNQMTSLHIIAFFVMAGYGEMQSAAAIGAAGLFGIGARPVFGILSDKIGREIVFTIAMGMTFMAVLVILLFTGGASLWALIIFVALTGLSDGLSGLLLGAKAADIYPSNVLGSVMGVVHVGRTMGTAVGGILTGLLFDMNGNYDLAYWIAAVLALLSIVAAWAVIVFETKPQVHKV
ncbi:MAG: MFS transporter [Dehalococcoidia bacterium]|nr:MFS transporter [Dehalococcoidia bacterium]